MASTRGYELAARLEAAGYHLRMTRDLGQAKDYFGTRYAEAPDARYGLVASSRDKILAEWGIPNDYQSTKVMRLGPWYGDGEESHPSCASTPAARCSPAVAMGRSSTSHRPPSSTPQPPGCRGTG
jgi:hypothetical protein